jgi:site-specific recombinase XerD
LAEEFPKFGGKAITDFTLEDLEAVTSEDVEEFVEYLSYYVRRQADGDVEHTNDERGKSRKLSAVRTMLAYFFKKQKLSANVAERVDFPKIHEKNIIMLEINEVARLLDEVESGEKLTEQQKRYHHYTKSRDLAIISLLLGTGMRVSECVGIDLAHIDFDILGVKVTRKGGSEVILYFGREVEEALQAYLVAREGMEPKPGSEDALFLSLQNSRITTRAVQLLVKKYAELVTTMKKISPHKLRSTYGTQLYRETGDIYLVADALGHANINTTKKHYARMDEERRKQAAEYVKLRKE